MLNGSANIPGPVPKLPHSRDEAAIGGEALDPVVTDVEDIEGAVGCEGDRPERVAVLAGQVELALAIDPEAPQVLVNVPSSSKIAKRSLRASTAQRRPCGSRLRPHGMNPASGATADQTTLA